MTEAVSHSRDPIKVKAGRIGATKRWGPEPRVIRLADVEDPELRAAFLALHRLGESRNTAETKDAAKSNAPASSRAEASMLPEVRHVRAASTD